MGSNTFVPPSITWVLTFSLCVSLLLSRANPQIPECSLQGIDLSLCFNQGGNPMDPCCKAFNQMLEVGYHCFCALLGNASPLFSGKLLFAISSCYVSLPPVARCQVPVTVVAPPRPRKNPDPAPPSAPSTLRSPLVLPPHGVQQHQPSPQIGRGNSTLETQPPHSEKAFSSTSNIVNITNIVKKSNGPEKSRNWLYMRVILILVFHLVFHACMI